MRHGHPARIGPSKLVHATSCFVLSCGLTACDPPWSASTETEALSATSVAPEDSSRVASTPPVAVAAMASRAAKAEEPVAEPTPIPAEVELTPMEKAGDPEGNARLAVRYRNADELGDVVYFSIDGKREYALRRDAKEPDKYSAMIDFDFELFVEEQERRRRNIAEARLEAFDVFEGREWLGRQKFAFLDPEEIRNARDKSITLRISPDLIVQPVLPSDNPGKTLMITDLSVVRDPSRTFDICGNYGNPNGAWTFKTLMTNMANPSATGVDPAVFVENWLQSWNTDATINGFGVPARTMINDLVLDAWPRIGGKLDLDQSPMRLLAIVNRLDLRSGSMGSASYGAGGRRIDAGEGRFVFGVVNRNANGGCSTMKFTVILEYRVPIQQCPAVRSYAQQWSALNGFALGSPVYNNALQAITDQFTTAGIAPAKPNGSAISQIRTNEIALGNSGLGGPIESARSSGMSAQADPVRPVFGDPWELREFRMLADHQLHLVSTRQTPHDTRNGTVQLANYINANTAAILNGTYVLPTAWGGQPLLTGSALNATVADDAVWDAAGINDQEARHKFSLGTCSGCHGGETRNQPADLSFLHIAPRAPTTASALSRFLVGNGTLAAPGTFDKPDPINPLTIRPFGDLVHRRSDLAALSVASCGATGLLQEAMFQPMIDVH